MGVRRLSGGRGMSWHTSPGHPMQGSEKIYLTSWIATLRGEPSEPTAFATFASIWDVPDRTDTLWRIGQVIERTKAELSVPVPHVEVRWFLPATADEWDIAWSAEYDGPPNGWYADRCLYLRADRPSAAIARTAAHEFVHAAQEAAGINLALVADEAEQQAHAIAHRVITALWGTT